MNHNPSEYDRYPIQWICDTKPLNTKTQIQRWLPNVPAERKTKIQKYKFIKDQALSLAAGLMLSNGLKAFGIEIHDDDDWMTYNDYGKPYLKDNPLYFNLSHSESMAMAVFAKTEVGCDIEYISKPDDLIAEKCFSQSEKDLYYQSDKEIRDQIFFKIWTLRESLLKAIGIGFSQTAPQFSVVSDEGLFVPVCTFNHRNFLGQNGIYQNYAYAWWMEI